MKQILYILIISLIIIPLTSCFFPSSRPPYCPNPFSNFGSWPYYSYDYYDSSCYPKAYDDYYS